MPNFSLLTKKEAFWLNFGHITRAGAEDPASDRLSIPVRSRLERSWTRGRGSVQGYKYRAGLERGRGSRNDVASTSTIDGPTSANRPELAGVRRPSLLSLTRALRRYGVAGLMGAASPSEKRSPHRALDLNSHTNDVLNITSRGPLGPALVGDGRDKGA